MGAIQLLNSHLVYAIVAAALGSGFQHGYHTGVINVPAEVFRNWENTTHHDVYKSWLDKPKLDLLWGITTSIMNVGGTIGGVLSGIASNKLGPKNGLLFNNILVILASLFMFLSKMVNSIEMMVIGRFLVGINCGFNCGLCPMYLSEISPVALRGAVGSIYQLVITISILISQIVGLDYILGNEDCWIHLFIIPIVIAIFQIVLLFFCVESPKYLVSVKNNTEAAEKAMKWLRKSEDVGEEMGEIKKEDDQNKALPAITLKDMFKDRSLKIPLFISIMVMLAQQFSGINAVIFYSTQTFQDDAGLKGYAPQYGTIGVGVINVMMTVVSVMLVDRAGRKTLLLIGFGGMALDTLAMSIAFHFTKKEKEILPWFSIVLVNIYIILFAAGAGSIPWFLVTELFNQAARPTAVSLAVPTNWIANFIVTLTFPSIQGLIKSFVFLIFTVLNLLFFFFIWKMVPETKNKTIEEITSRYK